MAKKKNVQAGAADEAAPETLEGAQDSQESAAPEKTAKGKAWAPKRGETVNIAEIDKKHGGQSVISLFLITAVGDTMGPKVDKNGKTVTQEKEFPTGKGKVTRTVAVMETIHTYDGVLFTALRQLPEPRRGVLVAALSPLEA